MFCCTLRGGGCARFSALALAHVNLMLVLYVGAGLAAAARLKWDPSAYIPVREALPLEYRVLSALLCAGALALLLLAHLALCALAARPRSPARRASLLTYATLMTAVLGAEGAAGAWVWWRVRGWLGSAAARDLADLARARDHLQAALAILSRWFTLPDKLTALLDEAEADIPRNLYVAGGAAAALVALQAAAVALALVAASPRPRAPRSPAPRPSLATMHSTASAGSYSSSRFRYFNESRNGSENAPLRTAYRNGRLVIV